jgi:uncharacterized protein YPO0396
MTPDTPLLDNLLSVEDERAEQFRLSLVQMYNWGTFSGLFRLPIPREGWLLMGKSGSGKSTILDAYSALLTPPRWLNFNLAAQGAKAKGHDRSALSYLRGAVGDKTSQEVGVFKEYLRKGTTMGAIAVTFSNAIGAQVTLVQLLYIRGASTQQRDVRRLYMVVQDAFDLKQLEVFAQTDFDVRKLKAALPQAFIQDQFLAYQERFMRLLGIDNDLALRLLHKTQSIKELGDLNEFLREFALDVPETFDVAKRLQTDFAELNAAHAAVVTAREQLAVLDAAHGELEQLRRAALARSVIEELQAGHDEFLRQTRLGLYEQKEAADAVELDAAAQKASHASQQEREAEEALSALRLQRSELGADVLESLEQRLQDARGALADCERRRTETLADCRVLGWTLPDSADGFSRLVSASRNELESGVQAEEKVADQHANLKAKHKVIESRMTQVRGDIAVLERQRSNIEPRMLLARGRMSGALGIDESRLPFVGELLQVRSTEAEWEGAIERVLHGFALSLLVPEALYGDVAAYLDRTHTGVRLVYLRALPHTRTAAEPSKRSLALKVEVAPGPFEAWLQEELRSRFDYVCCESIEEFKREARAVTRMGQVKHGPGRHEKDDRHNLMDRSQWVLGFDNTAKRSLLAESFHTLAREHERVAQQIRELTEQRTRANAKLVACQHLTTRTWSDIDVATYLTRIDALGRQLAQERQARPDLARLEEDIRQAQTRVTDRRTVAREAEVARATCERTLNTTREHLAALRSADPGVGLTPTQRTGLADRYFGTDKALTLAALDGVARRVTQKLADERSEQQVKETALAGAIQTLFRQFVEKWPADAGGLDPALASAPDFMARRDRLRADGLPQFEQRFRQLLRNQSDQNLTRLSTTLNQERHTIAERIDTVNEGLRITEFNPGTHIVIEARERSLEAVREFNAILKAALAGSFAEDETAAEARFAVLSDLVQRLSSEDAADVAWRNLALDVRQHVEFIARELTHDGDEVEVYLSSSGKSGGQRQKLAATCLAAALRYQLGSLDRRLPPFAPVVLDEAFNNADPDFTAMSLNVFRVFGFQIIAATPMKAVMAMEPFVGGGCFVKIVDNRKSTVMDIEYIATESRLNLQAHADAREALETAAS